MSPDGGAAQLLVLLAALWIALAVWGLVEWWTHREQDAIAAMHHCHPGCRCRGTAGRQRP